MYVLKLMQVKILVILSMHMIYMLTLLRQSTVSAPIGFTSEAVDDDQVETSTVK